MTQRPFTDGRQTVLDRVLLILAEHGKMTAADISEQTHDSENSVRSAIRRGHKIGLLRITTWHAVKPNRYAAVWTLADGKRDQPRPLRKPPEVTRKMRAAEYRKRNRLVIAMRNYPRRGKPVPIGFQLTYRPREKKC